MPHISVIICTHNPREHILERTLDALKKQSQPLADWELLVIDNNSKTAVAEIHSLDWHPNGRHLREDELGLTPARLCGIRESRTNLLLFVDDDNLLAPDYLETSLRISQDCPFLGVWGGSCIPEFEEEPEEAARPFLRMLAIREVTKSHWSNLQGSAFETIPYGAGMVVRKTVADAYMEQIKTDPVRVALDRRGDSLASAGDVDLAFTASDLGMGSGVLKELSLVHLIPPGRTSRDYLVRMAEESRYSNLALLAVRGIPHTELELPSPPHGLFGKLVELVARFARPILQSLRDLRLDPFERDIERARRRGRERARDFHRSLLRGS